MDNVFTEQISAEWWSDVLEEGFDIFRGVFRDVGLSELCVDFSGMVRVENSGCLFGILRFVWGVCECEQ
jgi:hypothetical protein